MNTYGHTTCPDCTAYNSLYRPEKELSIYPAFDSVDCWMCGLKYKHTDQLKKLKETEAQATKRAWTIREISKAINAYDEHIRLLKWAVACMENENTSLKRDIEQAIQEAESE